MISDGGNGGVSGFKFFEGIFADAPKVPVKVSSRAFRLAIEEALIHTYTRQDLETVLAEELKLSWPKAEYQPTDDEYTKRDVIKGYTDGWNLPRFVALARRMVVELEVAGGLLDDLNALLAEYDRGGGVGTPAKNLIFAANGPKPELVLRDAVNNDIEITRNGEYCLVFDQPIPADGLTYSQLIEWWRKRQGAPEDSPAREVGLDLHNRLRASLDNNPVELRIFDAYAARYKDHGFDIPALIPQVYLHFDPATPRPSALGGPLAKVTARYSDNGWTSSSCSPAGTASSSRSMGSSTTQTAIRQALLFTARWSPRTVGSGSPATRSTGSVGPS